MPLREEDLVREYQAQVGKEPETRFPDDPDWLYRGTKAEREELERRVLRPDEQESLFDDA